MKKIWRPGNMAIAAALSAVLLCTAAAFGGTVFAAVNGGMTKSAALSLAVLLLMQAALVIAIPEVAYRHVEFDEAALTICGAYGRRTIPLASVSILERVRERRGKTRVWRWYASVPSEEQSGWLEQVPLPLPSSPDSAGVQELIAAMRNANPALRLDIQESLWD